MNLWTFPGKLGDCFLQWPVCRRYQDQVNEPFGVAIGRRIEPLKSLLECQPGVKEVQVWDGITNYGIGGQPWDFGGRNEAEGYSKVIHAGFRVMPSYMITQFVRDQLGMTISSAELGAPSLFIPGQMRRNYCVIHGTLVTHRGCLPRVWPMVTAIEHCLDEMEVVVVGTDEERWYSRRWVDAELFNDHGDWKLLASLITSARFVIAAGSSVAALAGSLGTPCARIHDEVNGLPAHVWSHPGPDQANITEMKPQLLLDFVEEHCGKSGRAGGPADHRESENLASSGLGSQRE